MLTCEIPNDLQTITFDESTRDKLDKGVAILEGGRIEPGDLLVIDIADSIGVEARRHFGDTSREAILSSLTTNMPDWIIDDFDRHYNQGWVRESVMRTITERRKIES
jgi:hypothetical protein